MPDAAIVERVHDGAAEQPGGISDGHPHKAQYNGRAAKPCARRPHDCGKALARTMCATASSKPPLPGRYSGRFARCQLWPFGSQVFFGLLIKRPSMASAGSLRLAAVMATMGKSQPQVSSQRHSAKTFFR